MQKNLFHLPSALRSGMVGPILMCLGIITILPRPGLAASLSGPQIELSIDLLDSPATSPYTASLTNFGYYHNKANPNLGATVSGALVWPVMEHLSLVVSAANPSSSTRFTREHFEHGYNGEFSWDIYALSGALRVHTPIGSDSTLYIQAGAGPSLNRTTLTDHTQQRHVDNQLGHQVNASIGSTYFFSSSLGISWSFNKYRLWAMTNDLAERHIATQHNVSLGMIWKFGANAS